MPEPSWPRRLFRSAPALLDLGRREPIPVRNSVIAAMKSDRIDRVMNETATEPEEESPQGDVPAPRRATDNLLEVADVIGRA